MQEDDVVTGRGSTLNVLNGTLSTETSPVSSPQHDIMTPPSTFTRSRSISRHIIDMEILDEIVAQPYSNKTILSESFGLSDHDDIAKDGQDDDDDNDNDSDNMSNAAYPKHKSQQAVSHSVARSNAPTTIISQFRIRRLPKSVS